MSVSISSISQIPLAKKTYTKILEYGFVPRRPFAHYFMNTDGIRSRIHLQNYYSIFFPDTLVEAEATIWLHDMSGKLISTTKKKLKPFGQIYLELNDLLSDEGETEGMVYVDLKPPSEIRELLKNIPRIIQNESSTPFWVSYHDENENYMYVHSIESYRAKVFGAIWPVRKLMERAVPNRPAWQSWRLLDVQLLDELQIIVMNHSHLPGVSSAKLLDENSEVVWNEEFHLEPRAAKRIKIPSELISRWKGEGNFSLVRIGVDPLFTSNGKPYVLLKYGGGPQSIHHG
jgi:hypothetical protein